MKGSHLLAALAILIASALALPLSAQAFTTTGGGGTQTQTPYGLWYAGQEACAQEGCHSQIASKETVHSRMVTDIKSYPSALAPAADSSWWPLSSPLGGPIVRGRDVYLQIGDPLKGFREYVGYPGSVFATGYAPADDLPVLSPVEFFIDPESWMTPTTAMGGKAYLQSCGPCHNLGVTRPSNAAYPLVNGASETSKTPSTVSAFSIQCEVCHGTGKNPNGHHGKAPDVVAGNQMLKAQVCGQCHESGATPQKNVTGAAFGNPNGYTTDTTLSAAIVPFTTVETETTFMNYLAKGGTKPRFLPNGANYSMRHSYYNEWLVSMHGTAPNSHALTGADPRCARCHSGLSFLNRIAAKGPNGVKLVASVPGTETLPSVDPGISCQICHGGHITANANGGYDERRRWADGHEVWCGDCHNWRFEQLDLTMQHETIGGKEYTRPPLNTRPHASTREVFTGGWGGEDGVAGLWGVAPTGEFMPGTTCQDCHMPKTYREDIAPNVDDGNPEATRKSHSFKIVLPGDAARWQVRKNGDSCAITGCHKLEAAEYTRADFQRWIDETSATVVGMSLETSNTLGLIGNDLGFTRFRSFEATQPTEGAAATITPAAWTMLQHAGQNLDIASNEGSHGLHNPTYVIAGLKKALFWARSYDATISASLDATAARGAGMTVAGSLKGGKGLAIPDAVVALERSTDGGAHWSVASTASVNASGAFTIPTGSIVGDTSLRVAFDPAPGVRYVTSQFDLHVPVTSVSVLPVAASGGWVDAGSVVASLSATPGSLTFYTLSGATTLSQTLYLAPITITAQGRTDLTFWSANSDGAEAPRTVALGIDRSAPTLTAPDLAAAYTDRAKFHLLATDSGAGVASLAYSVDGGAPVTTSAAWTTVDVTRPGRHSLHATALDAAGRLTAGDWSFSVRSHTAIAPAASRRTVAAGKRWTYSATVRTLDGAPVSRALVAVQRSTDRVHWKTVYRPRTAADGSLSASIAGAKRGTVYWRTLVPADASYFASPSASTKVTVR